MTNFVIVILSGIIVFLMWVVSKLTEKLKRNSVKNESVKTNGNELKLKQENENLKLEINSLKNKISILNKERETIIGTENSIKEKQNLKIKELEKQLEEKEKNIGKSNDNLDEIYNNFTKISENVKNKIEKILTDKKGKDVFVAFGSQSSNLKLLWEQIEFNIQRKEHIEDTKILIETYYYFFNLYNQLYSTPVYTFLEVEVGTRYNPIISIPVNTNYSKNEVKEIVFKGYTNKKGEIVKKSLVILD